MVRGELQPGMSAWKSRPIRSGATYPGGPHWTTRALVAAARRAFARVDEEIGDFDREWVEAEHAGAALLLRVDPAVGLTEGDVALRGEWAAANAAAAGPGAAPAAVVGGESVRK